MESKYSFNKSPYFWERTRNKLIKTFFKLKLLVEKIDNNVSIK